MGLMLGAGIGLGIMELMCGLVAARYGADAGGLWIMLTLALGAVRGGRGPGTDSALPML